MAIKTIGLMALALAGGGAASPPSALDQESYRVPAKPWPDVEAATGEQACRDRIDQVRAEAGKPTLERQPADPDKPMLLYAVDTRVAGCGVIVPVADPTDLRPGPAPGPPQIIRAR